ncbi:MAG: alpha/beta hydrolase fold domain-containing protein [Candidatus Marinimicrobia bacterium]|nr:alpha/beta hydrolase fold domain-containing protein [Candidatus Neomarinimicrobiota bacterium]
MKEKNTLEAFARMRNRAKPPRLMENMFSISSKNIFNREVWSISSRKDRKEQYIFFIHGGAYAANFTPGHWFLIGALVDKLNCTVIAPDYPLTPEETVNNVFDMLIPVYKDLIERVGEAHVTFMGDSSGGGLVLALSQYLHQKGIVQPSQLFLLSPWLDVTMDNPEIMEIDKLDPILNIQGLIDAGIAYAGNLDRRNYLVSPLFGSLEGLPPITLFVGDNDILMPDCRKFREKAINAGYQIDYNEIKGLLHDGMLYPTSEGKACREFIFNSLNSLWKNDEK